MTVILIIAILAVMLLPSFTGVFRRGEKIRCMANLRTLYFGANSYVQDHNFWPQINPGLIKTPEKYAAAWQEALDRYERKEIVPLARGVRERLAALEPA